MVSIRKVLLSVVVIFLSVQFTTFAQLTFDVEGGVAATGYNDVRISGSGGTFISFSDELNSNPIFYSRVRAGYRFGSRSEVLALYAPLKFRYKGAVGRDVVFQGETYPAGMQLNATYKFNSYRVTYRYFVLDKSNLEVAVGLTAKVRDANIGIRGDSGLESEKTDLGVVPLVNFWVHWHATDRLGLLLDGDALAAPQGRAEDVLAAVTYKVTDRFSVKAGYRILEGGADNDSVYTFSLFHYGLLGVIISLD
ncbi:MAG: hypothetical protein ACLFNU_02455 [Bacteroidales bacterium]